MSTLKVSAFSKAKLPSKMLFDAWIAEWEEKHGGNWTLGPAQEGPNPTSPATRSVTFANTTSSPNADIETDLDKYNETHHGNDEISWTIS